MNGLHTSLRKNVFRLQYNVEIWDNIGALVDQIIIETEPLHLSIWKNVCAIASLTELFIWHFHDINQRIQAEGRSLPKR